MSRNLEKFVQDNREAFDKFEPGPVVWHNIQQDLKNGKKEKAITISMKTLRWSAAAAIILLLGAGAWFFSQQKQTAPEIAGAKKTAPVSNDLPKTTRDSANAINPADEQQATNNEQLASTDKDEYSEELYHYTRLVELKQEEIKKIQKDEPLLYQQFAGDINKLDSTFHTLKKQLPENPNREQLLEAMIQNLQLQEALLNRQLNIIKQINNAKKTEYEKAIKSA
jgi:hypothetical protein